MYHESAFMQFTSNSLNYYSYQQNDSMHKFESAPLDQWTVEDVGDWLEMIGFGDLRAKFEGRSKFVDCK